MSDTTILRVSGGPTTLLAGPSETTLRTEPGSTTSRTSATTTRLRVPAGPTILKATQGLPGTSAPSPLTTKGDLYTFDVADQRLPVGADGQFLRANAVPATGLEWDTLDETDLPRLPEVSAELGVNFAAVVTIPVYATLFTLALTTVLPSSYLFFMFTANWRHVGGFAGNAAVNFQFRLNGGLLTGNTTDNKVANQIGNVARTRRVVVAAGLQTLVVEVSKFGAAGNSVVIDAGTRPDLNHAALFMQEQE